MEASVPLLGYCVSIKSVVVVLAGGNWALTCYAQEHKYETEADDREVKDSQVCLGFGFLVVIGSLCRLCLKVLLFVVGVLFKVAPEKVKVACGYHGFRVWYWVGRRKC